MQSIPRISKSHHAAQRCAQRGISDTALTLAIHHGERLYANGVIVYFLGRKSLPEGILPRDADRLNGTTAVVTHSGIIITAYRCRRALARLRRTRKPRAQHPL